jgi:hypothetical protein
MGMNSVEESASMVAGCAGEAAEPGGPCVWRTWWAECGLELLPTAHACRQLSHGPACGLLQISLRGAGILIQDGKFDWSPF